MLYCCCRYRQACGFDSCKSAVYFVCIYRQKKKKSEKNIEKLKKSEKIVYNILKKQQYNAK